MNFNKKNFFFSSLLFWKFFAFIYTFYIFAVFSKLGDSESFLNPYLPTMDNVPIIARFTNRQILMKEFFAIPFRFDFSANIYLFLFASFYLLIFYIAFKNIIKCVNNLFFWMLMFSPSFLVWSTSLGKESIIILVYILFFHLLLIFLYKDKLYFFSILALLIFAFHIRPNYTLPYIFLFIGAIYYKFYLSDDKIFRNNNILNLLILALVSISSLLVIIFYKEFIITKIEHYMYVVRRLFINDGIFSLNNSIDVEFFTIIDLFKNMYWGIPVSLIGPSLLEMVQSPFKIIYIMDGLLSFVIFYYFSSHIIRSKKTIVYFFIFFYIPSVILIIFLHYPFGLFNSGSALRYKMALVPLFSFFPLMLSGYIVKYGK